MDFYEKSGSFCISELNSYFYMLFDHNIYLSASLSQFFLQVNRSAINISVHFHSENGQNVRLASECIPNGLEEYASSHTADSQLIMEFGTSLKFLKKKI